MRRYETIFILDPDLSEEGRVPVFEKLEELIPGQGGTLLEMNHWGSRRLAYEIKKRKRGYYVKADYCGDGAVVNEMERFFRIDDRILKYMTVLLEKEADLEKLQAEFTKEEESDEPSEDKAGNDTDAQAEGEKPESEEQPETDKAITEDPVTEKTEEA